LIELFIAYFLSRKILFFGQKGIDMDRIILFSLYYYCIKVTTGGSPSNVRMTSSRSLLQEIYW